MGSEVLREYAGNVRGHKISSLHVLPMQQKIFGMQQNVSIRCTGAPKISCILSVIQT